jgi:NitT/TauT family transport system ATP-binding protein
MKASNFAPTIGLSKVGVSFTTADATAPVLDGITLDIPAGQTVVICGVSGVGKSTFLRVLAGLHPVTTGTYTWDGNPVTGSPAGVGYVVQDFYRSLFPWLSVQGNLLLALRRSRLDKNQKRDRVSRVLSEVGLTGKEKFHLWELSGGMAQRVAIGRALIGDTRLLLMDEPFASLDAQVRAELEDLTLSIFSDRPITTVIVTHDIDEAIYMADRVIVLSGQPAKVVADIPISLPKPRNQLTTRESADFGVFRRRVVATMWPHKAE